MLMEFLIRRLIALAVIAFFILVGSFWLRSPPPPPQVEAAGAQAGIPEACARGSRAGPADLDKKIRTADGLHVVVRTPKDYDPERAYPLIVVYPPARMSPRRSEFFYDLTTQATSRGFILAYSNHMPLTREAIAAQAKVAATVQKLFCIDGAAITFLGHSDGGSIAEGLVTFGRSFTAPPENVVASAAGVTRADLAEAACPRVPAIMIVHNPADRLFPDFGRAAAEYWRRCASCSATRARKTKSGCMEFKGCSDGRRVVYCETRAPHSAWPQLNAEILNFIQGRPLFRAP
jgi:polyhydroxybutyrate depolymerase